MRRIRRRLLVSFLAVVTAVIVGLALASGLALRSAFLDRLEGDMARQARELAVVLDGRAGLGSRPALDPESLQTLARDAGRAAEVRFTIIARDGRVLADSEEDPASMENHASRPEVVSALAGEEGRQQRYSTTLETEMVYVAVPLGTSVAPWSRGVVRAAVPAARIDPELTFVQRLPFYVGAALLIPVLALTYLLSRSLTRPIEHLRSMAVAVAGGDLGYRVGVLRKDELGELAEALNDMAAQLEERVEQLVSEREQVAEILAVMGDGVLVLDDRGNVVTANRAAADLLGSSVAALEGKPIVRVARGFPALTLAEAAAHAGRPVEERRDLPGSRTFWIQAIPLRGAVGRAGRTLILFRDETARARVERMRRDFVSNVSHELKTPLAGMALLAATLRHAVSEDPEQARRFAERLAGEIARLSNLVNDLLTLSRLEEPSPTQASTSEPVDLAEAARDSAAAIADRATAKGLQLTVTTPGPVWVRGDRVELETLARNLLDNAVRYTDPGGRVDLEVADDDTVARLVVRDTGAGIPRADQPRIFERFYRVDKARSRETGGTGLGLSIVRHIAEKHGGSVEVESTLGVGSTFTVRLPLLSRDRPAPAK